MASSTTPMPPAAVLATWETIGDALKHYKIEDSVWRKIAENLGDAEFQDIGVLAGVDDADFRMARDGAGISPLLKGAVNLMFGAIKAKFNLATEIVKQLVPAPADSATSSEPQQPAAAASTTAIARTDISTQLIARVKLSQVINQTIDQEVPLLPPEALAEARNRYIALCGDEPLPGVAATDAQLTALSFLISNSLPPYADFAVFNPYGTRMERKLRFTQHFMSTEGKWRAVEVAGPSNLDKWKACWEVFAAAAVSLDIATPAVLARYSKRFEDRCSRYPLAWHVCATAEDRCRSEWMATEKRRQERFMSEHPQMAVLDAARPWNAVFREAADSIEYWAQELQEPALLYETRRGDQAPSYTRQQEEQKDVSKFRRKGKGKGEKGKGKGSHPIWTGAFYKTNQKGEYICVNFNKHACVEECPRAHQCSYCLGQHSALNCPKSSNTGKKQKKGGAKASSSKE